MTKTCVSLFSCAGFGDLGLRASGVDTLVANELLPDRANLMQTNFPESDVVCGDITSDDIQDSIVNSAEEKLDGKRLDLIIASPPCQSMSTNGRGRMSSACKQGKRDTNDPRSSLIIPALNVMKRLGPKVVVIENVPGMRHERITNEFGERELILDMIYRQLPEYVLRSAVLDVADYGVPQRRKRLITIAVSNQYTAELRIKDYFMPAESSPFHPEATHAAADSDTGGKMPWVTLETALGHLPELDAIDKLQDDDDPYHIVPRWSEAQHFCMSHTPEGKTAFDNIKCALCEAEANDMKAIRCQSCSGLLPRPRMRGKDGEWRLIKAFKTAYRRMQSRQPANALTTNSGVISSDVKCHPRQHRVLSLREVMIVASICTYPTCDIDFSYVFPSPKENRLIRDVIGECIPPLLAFRIGCHVNTTLI